MWLHHDLAWWGAFLGGVALVLMLPANIVANLVTPKLKNWWAERSVASTRERIEKLKKQLADYEQHPELSELKDCALKAFEGVGILGFLCVQLSLLKTRKWLAEFRKKQSPFDRASLRAWIKTLEEKLARM